MAVPNSEIVVKCCYFLIGMSLVSGLISTIAFVEIKSGNPRKKLKYSDNLQRIKDPQQTDK
jgi:hypothetical protein